MNKPIACGWKAIRNSIAWVPLATFLPGVAIADPPSDGLRVHDTRQKHDEYAENTEALLKAGLQAYSIEVTVRNTGKDQWVAFITGKKPKQEQADAIYVLAERLRQDAGLANVRIVKAIRVQAPDDPTPSARIVWPLSNLLGDPDLDGKLSPDKIVTALNAFYLHKDTPALATLENGDIWLSGPLTECQGARAFLTMLDAPPPQIRLDTWAIQFSGDAKAVQEQMETFKALSEETATSVNAANALIVDYMRNHRALFEGGQTFEALRSAGFKVNFDRYVTPIEALITIGVSDNRATLMNGVCDAISNTVTKHYDTLRSIGNYRGSLPPKPEWFKNLRGVMALGEPLVADNFRKSDQASVNFFIDKLVTYSLFVDRLGLYGNPRTGLSKDILEKYPDAPEELARQSVAIDRLLHNLIDAYAKDMQEMFIQPLWKYASSKPGGNGGIGLVGHTRVVVTSRRRAEIAGTTAAYGEQQKVNLLGKEFFNAATTGSDKSAAGLDDLLKNVTPLEATMVKAALQPTVDTKYYQIAPGISVKFTPSMTGDGTSADLALDANFGVETHSKEVGTTSTLDFHPPDTVKSHTIKTVANVAGFNLFEVTSFDMDTIYPRPAFVTPILGQFPIIGNIFRFPRGSKRTHHQSMILVNATLLPRSLGLVGFYGANKAGGGIANSLSSQKPDYENNMKAFQGIKVKSLPH